MPAASAGPVRSSHVPVPGTGTRPERPRRTASGAQAAACAAVAARRKRHVSSSRVPVPGTGTRPKGPRPSELVGLRGLRPPPAPRLALTLRGEVADLVLVDVED